MFDETYYAKDACLYLGLGQDFCTAPLATEQSWVHPPLGKWLIAAGIKFFGYDAFGWRVSSAVFGTVLVVLVFVLARTLFRDRAVAGLAGFLAATDFMLVVQSRIAMLDIFLAFFVVLGFLFLTFDRNALLLQREHLRLPFPEKPPERNIEWRFAAGAAFGLAVAVKWSAVWALIGAGILALAWSYGVAKERTRSKATSDSGNRWFVNELSLTFLSMVALPLFAYAMGYTLWLFENGFDFKEFYELQDRMLRFHLDLKATHGYQSKAWTWPLVIRPVAYFYEGEPKSVHVMSFGNPAVWWAAIPAGLYLAFRSLRS
ncbi:MAG: phospholipid carrier-dependent glycosyltransferase, partial [Acidimicrobiia bacterium]